MPKRSLDRKGKLIVIDGMDGSGKGTQITFLKEKLAGKHILFTREPGGSPLGEEIREMLLRTNGPASNPVCDFFLFFASRGLHIEDVVAPTREKGISVISDRYDSSTFAFQIRGEKTSSWLEDMFVAVRGALPAKKYHPDLYIVLDLPAKVAYARRKHDAAQAKSKFDIKPLAYHERVRKGFQAFAKKFGPVVFVNAERTPEEIHIDMWKLVSRELGL